MMSDDRLVYRGKIFDVVEKTIAGGRKRQIVVHPGAIAVAAVDRERRIVLVRQHREGAGKQLWEVPAGTREPDEDPLTTAKRELMEETGFSASVWRHLSTFYLSPGYVTEVIHLYFASGLEKMGSPDEDEIAEMTMVPLSTAELMVTDGRIQDAKTMVAIFMAAGMGKGMIR